MAEGLYFEQPDPGYDVMVDAYQPFVVEPITKQDPGASTAGTDLAVATVSVAPLPRPALVSRKPADGGLSSWPGVIGYAGWKDDHIVNEEATEY